MINLEIEFKKTEILRYLGYMKGTTIIPDNIDALIDASIREAYSLVQPRGKYKTFEIQSIEKSKILLKEGYSLESKDISTLLKGCKYISIMAATVGNGIEEHIDKLFNSDEYAKATIFDAIGSDGAEKVIDALCNMVKKKASNEGFTLTKRFSPGYGDFDLSNQKNILDLLVTKEIGLQVTGYNILVPRKSVTAIIGWTKELGPQMRDKSCEECKMYKCNYRREDNWEGCDRSEAERTF